MFKVCIGEMGVNNSIMSPKLLCALVNNIVNFLLLVSSSSDDNHS